MTAQPSTRLDSCGANEMFEDLMVAGEVPVLFLHSHCCLLATTPIISIMSILANIQKTTPLCSKFAICVHIYMHQNVERSTSGRTKATRSLNFSNFIEGAFPVLR